MGAGQPVGGGGGGGGGVGNGEQGSNEKERYNIAREVLETERKYVEALAEMVEAYKLPLSKMAEDPSSRVQKADVQIMFSNVETLRSLNQNILDQLDVRLKDWGPHQKIGDIFVQFAPFLKMYTAYGQGYQLALDKYNEINKDNVDILNNLRGSRPMSLEHLLIMPIQRVPRYNLLLQDLLKKTESSHPDFKFIEKALASCQEVANHINQSMRKTEQMNKLVKNANTEAFAGLLEASRSLLLDGVFHVDVTSSLPPNVVSVKQDLFGGGIKKSDKFHLFCFNDVLVHILKSEVKKTKDVSKSDANMYFNLVWLTDGPDAEDLTIVSPYRKLVVHFGSATDKLKWKNELTTCICKSLHPYPNNQGPDIDMRNPSPPDLRYGEFKWHDDIIYEGWWMSAKMHDEGKLSIHGSVYSGKWAAGLRSGHGRLEYANGCVYEGNFVRNSPNGTGVLTNPNNDVYSGEFQNGKMHGRGEMRWSNGDRFMGEWKSNKASGKGKLILKNGLAYDGEMEDSVPHGGGTLTMGNIYYMGRFQNGEKHGAGTMDYGNGLKYEGEWEENKYHGKGVFSNSMDNSIYEGEWLQGRKSGHGVMRFPNGDVYEGQWKNDARVGKGEIRFFSGESFSGHWKANVFHGQGVYTYKNGLKVEGKWNHGQLDGAVKVSGVASSTQGQTQWQIRDSTATVQIDNMSLAVDTPAEIPQRIDMNDFAL